MNRLNQLIVFGLIAMGSILLACGQAGERPSTPVAPPPPGTGANLVAIGGLRFGSCSGPGCEYRVEYQDDGTGCANNLHGIIRIFEGETQLESDDWWLNSSVVIKPGESIDVEDCCFSRDSVRRQTRFTSETFWNNVPCS